MEERATKGLLKGSCSSGGIKIMANELSERPVHAMSQDARSYTDYANYLDTRYSAYTDRIRQRS
jgi:hypothetical protein